MMAHEGNDVMRMWIKKKTENGSITVVILVLIVCFLILPAFGSAGSAAAADRNVEWGCFQNSPENNGVVGKIATPASAKEAALQWGTKMVEGYTTSFTPPLIIDGCLYTASDRRVYKLDKKTGKVKQQSDELKLTAGYAMNPITYDAQRDQLYVPLLRGRVQCLDAATLKSKWISEEYRYSQALSPIVCRDGLVYTGIWETETDDGVFFCLDAATGKTVWKYVPSEHGDRPHGFYWAGAYVNDDYVVVGSDDGTSNTFAEAADGTYTETAVVYCFDRRTGAIVDRIEGVKGDIRSTVVFHEGSIYFVSKGGRLYKAALGTDGRFGDVSWIQMRDGTGKYDAMMTAPPVVYKGRIYVGAAGSGGQFSADGGHMFAVVRDDAALSANSLIYTVPVSGYPQAAPLLSTATEKTDGKVRLYFTFNTFPGGIYYLEDSAQATAANHEKAHLLFRPEKKMQQYCISPLCCDKQGTLYYKNDSGYMMAVCVNKAWLNGITVANGKKSLSWNASFDKSLLNYELEAPNKTKQVTVKLKMPKGVKATVNGKTYKKNSKVTVKLKKATTTVKVTAKKTVSSKTNTRTYVLNIHKASDNAALAGMTINDSNAKPQIVDTDTQKTCDIGVGYDPAFDPSVTEYISRTYMDSGRFLNLWVQTEDAKAQVRVLPVSNVGNKPSNMNEDGSIRAASSGRFPVYWVKGCTEAQVDIEVTSGSGAKQQIYHVTLLRDPAHTDIGEMPLRMSASMLEMTVSGPASTAQVTVTYGDQDVTAECIWESTDPAVAAVSQGGIIRAMGPGEAEIWATYGAANLRTNVHVDVVE